MIGPLLVVCVWADGDSDSRVKISKALSQLEQQDEASRVDACQNLSRLPARDVLYFLQKALDDPRPAVHAACLSAVSVLAAPSEQPVEMYYQAITSPFENVRAVGVSALGALRPLPDQALHEIIDLLDRETASAVKERSPLCNAACYTAEAALKRLNTPEAQAALQREAEAFRTIQEIHMAEEQTKTRQTNAAANAEVEADARKEKFLTNLPGIALALVAAVFIISFGVRLYLRRGKI